MEDKDINWRKYEKIIHKQLQELYPDAEISHDVKRKGRYSGILRQIDVLIEDYVAGEGITIMIDGKFFSENIDVKEVESFIGMMQDVSADKGLLITQKGYSKAAISRAHNDPSRIELDVLNFEELKQHQAFEALPYSGTNGVCLQSPFGWVIDGTRREGILASLYQRGLSFDEAMKSNEWMYINILPKDDKITDLEAFCDFQEFKMLNRYQAEFSYQNTIKRKDAKTKLRIVKSEVHHANLEYTGIVEFNEFFFFVVLITPVDLVEKNKKKIEFIISKVQPLSVDENSVLNSNLKRLENELIQLTDKEEKANNLIQQGHILKKLERFLDSNEKYEESLGLFQDAYGAIKGKIDLYLLNNKGIDIVINEVDKLFSIASSEIVLYDDLMKIFIEYDKIKDLENFFKRKLNSLTDNKVKGNISFYLGEISRFNKASKKIQVDYYNLAKEYYHKVDVKEVFMIDIINMDVNILV